MVHSAADLNAEIFLVVKVLGKHGFPLPLPFPVPQPTLLRWVTANAEIQVPSTENPELLKFLAVKPRVG